MNYNSGKLAHMQPQVKHLQSRSWKVAGLSDVEFLWDQGSFFYPEHVHEGINIDLVCSGNLEYRIASHTVVAKPGTLIWLDHHKVHGAASISTEQMVIRSLFLSESFVKTVALETGVKNIDHQIRPVIQDANLSKELCALHEDAEYSDDCYDLEARILETLSGLFSGYSDLWNHSCQEHRAVTKVQEYIMEHCDERLTLQHLADLVQLNRCYLVRVFKKYIGMSPYNYLMQIRMARARKLLREGLPPADVAAVIGMADQSHLTRMFKRSWGTTPAAFARHRCKQ